MMARVHDVLGVGFGPANIALAVALDEQQFEGSVMFLEQRPSVRWQPEMLLPGSDIQNHPCRDLVTPRNPRSRYTFMNYLHEADRLFEHLNLGVTFPLRSEYAQYIAWVASFFTDQVRFNTRAETVVRKWIGGREVYCATDARGAEYFGRCVVIAPGRTPHIPPVFAGKLGPRVVHLNDYLRAMRTHGREAKSVAVVGGSQSAVEIVLHLNECYPHVTVHNVMRGYGYRLKDVSPFSGHVYFPEFVDYYYACSPDAKARLNRHLHYTNYSAADGDVINKLYLTMYEQRVCGRSRIFIHNCREILDCRPETDRVRLRLRESNTGELGSLDDLGLVILATGFKDLGVAENQERYPQILTGVIDDLRFNDRNFLHIDRDYSLQSRRAGDDLPPIYLNGLCESTHGYGDAGSFSLLALRAAEISQSILQRISHTKKVSSYE